MYEVCKALLKIHKTLSNIENYKMLKNKLHFKCSPIYVDVVNFKRIKKLYSLTAPFYYILPCIQLTRHLIDKLRDLFSTGFLLSALCWFIVLDERPRGTVFLSFYFLTLVLFSSI